MKLLTLRDTVFTGVEGYVPEAVELAKASEHGSKQRK